MFSISNQTPPCRGRRPIRPRGLQIALYPTLGSCKRPDFRIKQVIVMTDIAVSNGIKVTVVTTSNTPDMFSNHVIVTFCAFFKSLDSPSLHCIGSGVNSTVIVRCCQRHLGKNSQTSHKSSTNYMDLSERKISLPWLITSTI